MKGILFKTDMIRAIIEGRKTQTRRLSGLNDVNFIGLDGADQPTSPDQYQLIGIGENSVDFVRYAVRVEGIDIGVVYHCTPPRFQVGDIVYIKEAYYQHGHYEEKHFVPSLVKGVSFDAPKIIPVSHCQVGWHKRTPMFMPAWAARYFIKITGVRYEKLCSMSENDALAEGVDYIAYGIKREYELDSIGWVTAARDAYAALWDSINPKHPWASNVWVEVDSFVKWRQQIELI